MRPRESLAGQRGRRTWTNSAGLVVGGRVDGDIRPVRLSTSLASLLVQPGCPMWWNRRGS